MAINIEYENWRQAGDPLPPSDGSLPAGWSPNSAHGGSIQNGSYIAPGSSLPSAFGSNTNPVSSTQGIRDDMTIVTNEAQNILGEIGDEANSTIEQVNFSLGTTLPDLYSQTSEGQSSQEDIEALRASLGITTPQEEQQISQAGQAAYAEYAPIIAEAEQAKRQGMPKAIIGAGERGGFMSTQMAGGAALRPTEGGDFVGEGGELNRIKSDYDQVIQNAKARALAAKAAAEAAARKAIRTGKREDLSDALALRQQFQQESKDAITLANQKSDAISNYLSEKRTGIEFAQGQEDRKMKQATDELNLLLESGDGNTIEQNRDTITQLLIDAGYDNIEADSLIDSFKKKIEEANKKEIPKPELRTVDGNLYSIDYNEETGTYDTNLLIAKKPSGGGGGSTKITDNDRVSGIEDFIKEKNLIGEDNKVSWETYLSMKQTWVRNGGSETSFKTNFPIGVWLDEDNQYEYNLRIKGAE